MQLYRIKTPDDDTYEFTTKIDLNESYIHRIEKIIEYINFNARYKNEYARSIKRKIYRETNVVITLIAPYSSELHPEKTFYIQEAPKPCIDTYVDWL